MRGGRPTGSQAPVRGNRFASRTFLGGVTAENRHGEWETGPAVGREVLVKTKLAYVPGRGDVVWITLDPQAGHEQRGRRPALILSPAAYNGKVGLPPLRPITNQVKGYPFEVGLPDALPVTGVVLSDQVKSLDWQARDCTGVCRDPRRRRGPSAAKAQHIAGREQPQPVARPGIDWRGTAEAG